MAEITLYVSGYNGTAHWRNTGTDGQLTALSNRYLDVIEDS